MCCLTDHYFVLYTASSRPTHRSMRLNVRNSLSYPHFWCWSAVSPFLFASQDPDLHFARPPDSSASRTRTSWLSSTAFECRQRTAGTPPAAGRAGPSHRPTRPLLLLSTGARWFGLSRRCSHPRAVLDASVVPLRKASVCDESRI